MKRLLSLSIFITFFLSVSAQDTRQRLTPFTAVKWLQNNPYVRVNNDWYLLVMVNSTDAKTIVDHCKSKYPDKWQKRFSEDFNIMLEEMGKPLKGEVKLKLLKDAKFIDKTLTMTTDNRKEVLRYNQENPAAESGQTQKEIVDRLQKDIAATVNMKNEKIYPFKTARFEFNYTGHKFYSGSETVYIEDYGKTVIVISKKPDSPVPENITMIWKANQCTTLNHTNKTYYTTPIRPKATEPPVISYSTPEQRKQGGYIKKPNETLLGKPCEVYEHSKMKVTYWLWKNFELKIINYSLGSKSGYTKEPISAEENTIIPASIYKIPEGYKKQ